jgi:hypothetical protein
MGCDNSPYPRATARIGNRDQQDGQSKVLKKILEPLKYFAVAAIVTALILLGFQFGKENNSEFVQHLGAEKTRLESELAAARDEIKRLEVAQASAAIPVQADSAIADKEEEKAAQLPDPVPAPDEKPAMETSPQEPALGQISETFSVEPGPTDSGEEKARE